MNRKIVGIIITCCYLVFSSNLFAHTMMCGKGLATMVQSLKLDDGQKAKVKPIMDKLLSSVKDNGTQMQDISKQLDQQIWAADANQDTINGLIDKKTALLGSMMKARISAQSQILAILNPQQKAEFKMMVDKMRAKMADQYKNCSAE